MARIGIRTAALALALLWPWAVSAQDRVAFVLGNSSYETVGALANPVNDASDISIALEGLGFEVLLGTDLDREAMLAATERFAEMAAEADAALFYYAGHAFQVEQENYLVPVDAAIARVEDVADQTVPLQRLLAAVRAAPGLKLIFLDACRDNPFGAALEADPRLGEGLARVGSEADFFIAYATNPDNVAYDGTGRNSFFTEAMLSHIYTPGQDITDLLINVRGDVLKATGGRQIPYDISSLTRQFRFDPSPPTVSEETMLWQVAADAGDPLLMQLYLDRYPEGRHSQEVLGFLDTQSGPARSLGTVDDDAQAERLWTLARRTRMRPLLDFYLERYPDGSHADEARRLIAAIPRPEDADPGNVCERLATHPRDATSSNAGIPFSQLQQNALPAIQACSAAATLAPELPHYTALLARATAAAGDLGRAVSLYQVAADDGDLRAMVSLAQLYETGTGVAQDTGVALALYERAAEGGSEDAIINLAVSLFQGAGVPADPERAIALLRRAADDGSAKAIFNLGVLAQDGVVDAPADALTYFERAARAGETGGWQAAAILLDEGRGVARDPSAASVMLLRGAAEDSGQILAMMESRGTEWSRDTLAAMQARLARAGFYTSTVDGLPGPNLTQALQEWRAGGFDPEVLVGPPEGE